MKEDRQFVTALARGLEVLRCFTPERVELGTTEIARLTGMPQPTVWRLCYTLCKLEYLKPGKDVERLRVGPAVFALNGASIPQTGIAEMAYPLMADISQRFEASVSLAVRHGLQMIIIQRAEASTLLRLNLSAGSMLDIERSALGAAYLAGVSEEERAQILAQVRLARPDSWPANEMYLQDAQCRYRERGFVLNLRHYHPDVNAIGVPVIAFNGGRVLALNCGGSSSIVTEEKITGPIAAAMRDAAGRLSAMLA